MNKRTKAYGTNRQKKKRKKEGIRELAPNKLMLLQMTMVNSRLNKTKT